MKLSNFRDPDFVYVLTVCIFIILNLIRNVEYFYLLNEFKEGGIFSWSNLKLRKSRLNDIISKYCSFIFDFQMFVALLSLSSCAFISLLFLIGGKHDLILVLMSFLFIVNLIFSYRNILGGDGSDHLLNLLFVVIFIMTVFDSNKNVKQYSIYFVAAQSMLAYFTSGLVKLVSPEWRSGKALYGIFNTETYGNATVSGFLKTAPNEISLILSWTVIAMETMFPLVILLPTNLSLFFLVWGIIFHVINAVLMGLNRFFWAFLATYPSIIFVNLST